MLSLDFKELIKTRIQGVSGHSRNLKAECTCFRIETLGLSYPFVQYVFSVATTLCIQGAQNITSSVLKGLSPHRETDRRAGNYSRHMCACACRRKSGSVGPEQTSLFPTFSRLFTYTLLYTLC